MQTEGSLAITPRGWRSAETTRKYQGSETLKALGSLPHHCLPRVCWNFSVMVFGWHFLEFGGIGPSRASHLRLEISSVKLLFNVLET